MCGLTGMMGTLNKATHKDDTTVARELLILASFRGLDSTGIFGRKFSDEVGDGQYVKTTLESPEFINLPKVARLITDSTQLLIGHTRSRTVGEVNKRNAQPFDFDEIIGTHNGTLAWSTKNNLEGPGVNFPTDSEALYFRINEDGLAEALKRTDEKDAMALVWYNKKEHTLNMYRNALRTLHYVYDDKRKRMYWSSEAGMLYLALNRNNVTMDKVRLLPENVLYTWKLPDKRDDKIVKPVTQTIKQPKIPLVHTRSPMNSTSSGAVIVVNDKRGQSDLLAEIRRAAFNSTSATAEIVKDDWRTNKHQLTVVQGGKVEDFDPALFKLDRMIVRSLSHGGPFYRSQWSARAYDRDRFDKKMEESCGCCGASPVWGEPIKFLKDDNFLCASCVVEAQKEARAGRGGTDTTCQILKEYA